MKKNKDIRKKLWNGMSYHLKIITLKPCPNFVLLN